MLLLVRKVFWVDPDDLSALVAVVGKHILVTLQKLAKVSCVTVFDDTLIKILFLAHLDAVGMIISENIPGQERVKEAY